MEDKNTEEFENTGNPAGDNQQNSNQSEPQKTEGPGWKAIDQDPTKIKIKRNLGELAGSTWDFLKSTLSLRHGKYDYKQVADAIHENVVFEGYNVWILICSIAIASIGLNMNSIPVVIGAMLISPLMGPIRGIGFGVGVNDFQLLMKALKNFGVMVGVSLVTSIVYFLITPIDIETAELLGRTEPTFLDALIAFFGGLAGIIASSNGKNDTVINGVAIATALMPPLCTAGWGIANGEWTYFLGASYLFLLNSLLIALSTVVLLRYLKFPKREYVSDTIERKVQNYTIVFIALIMVPSVLLFYKMTRKSIFENNVETFVHEIIEASEDGINVTATPKYDSSNPVIELSVYNTYIDSATIRTWDNLKELYDLEDASIKVIQGEDIMTFMDKKIDAALGTNSGNNELAKMLNEKELTIARLRQEFDNYKLQQEAEKDPLEMDYLLRGFKEEYDEINQIAINRGFTFNQYNQLDTIYTIAVSFNDNVSEPQQMDLKKRLSRRFCFELKEKTNVQLDSVSVINL